MHLLDEAFNMEIRSLRLDPLPLRWDDKCEFAFGVSPNAQRRSPAA